MTSERTTAPPARQSMPPHRATDSDDVDRPDLFSVPPLRFVREYFALLTVSTLDIVLTYIILSMGGREVNPLADVVLEYYGHPGMVIYKMSIFIFVVVMCEVIARHEVKKGLWLARAGIAISAFPVVWSTLLLGSRFVFHFMGGG